VHRRTDIFTYENKGNLHVILGGKVLPLVRQETPASSLCMQLWSPQMGCSQSCMSSSSPSQSTLSSHIGPLPRPNCAPVTACAIPVLKQVRQTI